MDPPNRRDNPMPLPIVKAVRELHKQAEASAIQISRCLRLGFSQASAIIQKYSDEQSAGIDNDYALGIDLPSHAKEIVCELRKAGSSLEQIAEMIGTKTQAVINILAEAIETSPITEEIPVRIHQLICDLHKEGNSVQTISDCVGIDFKQVSAIVKRIEQLAGIDKNYTLGIISSTTKQLVCELSKGGSSLQEIAEIVGIKTQAVINILAEVIGISDSKLLEIVELRKRGKSLEDVSLDTGIDADLLNMILNQLPHGKVIEAIEKRLPGGLIYLGEVLNGKMHGQGELKWPDGSVYKGDLKEDLRSGRGTLNYPDGRFYDGDWMNDMFNGEGCYSWPNGDFYIGTWVDGVKSGFGKYEYSNNTSYEGDWLNDKPHGIGISVDASGVETRGEWRGGKLFHRLS